MIKVDEKCKLRITGKNEIGHNTILMSLKINDPKRPSFQEKWKLNNKEGRRKFNEALKQAYASNKIRIDNCWERKIETNKKKHSGIKTNQNRQNQKN